MVTSSRKQKPFSSACLIAFYLRDCYPGVTAASQMRRACAPNHEPFLQCGNALLLVWASAITATLLQLGFCVVLSEMDVFCPPTCALSSALPGQPFDGWTSTQR